ncbi:MAG: acrylyl-CoA reductase (NADPH) [Parasphingorhabdus sp.]|jgi:acrylyl-CoA reductase (NADPH)
MSSFKAFRIHQKEGGIQSGFEELQVSDLTDGDVIIKVAYSSVNYKDALAATGKGRILRNYPLNGGIDLAGIVESSQDSRFKAGDKVLVVGSGLSENLDGGYAEIARIPANCIVPLPENLTLFETMVLGTAGLTAALAVMRMEQMGQHPDMGAIVVTGATGGVGSIATNILSARGFDVVAFTGKREQHDYLRSLGAREILDRIAFEMGTRTLERASWGGAVDSVGGEVLSWLVRTTKPYGNVASIGLAGGHKLELTVMPFILRGVSLLGINSIEMPVAMRDEAWRRLGADLKPTHLSTIATRTIAFDELPKAFDLFLDGGVTGRTVVKIGIGGKD